MTDSVAEKIPRNRHRWMHFKLKNDGLIFNPEYGDIICVRSADGLARINVPRRISHYSVEPDWTGDQWQRRELSLLILDTYLPPNWSRVGQRGRHKATTKVTSGRLVSDDAFRLHLDFLDFQVSYLYRWDGGVIPGFQVAAWLRGHDVQWTQSVWELQHDQVD